MISMVGAELTTFDNVKIYDEVTQTVTVKNLFGLGKTYADVKLNTPLNNMVARGYGKVAEFTIVNYEDYDNVLKELELYDKKNNDKKFERDFDFKVLTYEDVVVDDYNCVNINIKGFLTSDCKIIGNHIEQKEVWTKLILTDLKESEIVTIGIFTEVLAGDKVEWIPNLFGVRVNEWAKWTESLNAGLHSYYAFEEESAGTIVDELGNYNLTNTGSVSNVTGKINYGYDFTIANTDYFSRTALSAMNDDDNWAINLWIAPDDETTRQVVLSNSDGTDNFALQFLSGELTMKQAPTFAITGGTYTPTLGNWAMITLIHHSNTTMLLYVNGVSVTGGSQDVSTRAHTNFGVGINNELTSYPYNGDMDELGVWNRTLTASEIAQLYNSGTGITYIDSFTTPPTSTLNSPADLVTVTNPNVVFNATGTDDTTLQNMTLYVNESLISTNTSVFNNTLTQFAYTLPSVGYYNWTVGACDDEDTCTNATYRGITYANSLTVSLETPNNQSTFYDHEVDFECLVSDDTSVTNVSLVVNGTIVETILNPSNNTSEWFAYNISDGFQNWTCEVWDNVNASYSADVFYITGLNDLAITLNAPPVMENFSVSTFGLNGTGVDDTALMNISLILNATYNGTINTPANNTLINFDRSLADGFYNWTMETCDVWDCEEDDTWNFTVDTTVPIVNDAENITDLVVFSLPVNSTWNYTATDTHIDSCYYNTSENATYVIETCNASINTSWTTGGNHTIHYCVNDTFGLETCNDAWVYVYSVSYTQTDDLDPVGEGVDVTFDFNLSLTDIATTTATLLLNNTYYSVGSGTCTNDYCYFDKTVTIPDGYGNTTGFPQLWRWNYTITGITTNQTTYDTNVTVYAMALDDCSVYGDVILNLTLKDEEANTQVNGSLGSNIEIDLTLTSKVDSSLTWEYSNTWVNDSNVAICIPNNILNNSEYTIEFDLGFDSTGRVWEFFFLDSGTLNSTKVFDGQTDYTINLFDLLTTDSTSFLFNYFDNNGLVVEDIIVHTFRKYIGEGLFREIERSKADQNADTIIHLVEEDVIYYFLITQYGIPLYTSSTYSALCQAVPCSIQLSEGGDLAVFSSDYDLVDGGSYELTSDTDTRIVTLDYLLDTSQEINLTVYKFDYDGTVSVVSSNASTGTADTLTVFVPLSAGNVSFIGSVYKDTSFINSEWVLERDLNAQSDFGVTLSIFLAILLILTLGLIAVTEGAGTIIMVILGVAVAGFLGLITTNLSTGIGMIAYLVIAGGVIIWKLSGGRK